MFLKQVSLHWVGVASFLVLLISMLLASWFISNRETDSSALHQNEKEGSKEEDILPKLTRIDPVKVTLIIMTFATESPTYFLLVLLLLYKDNLASKSHLSVVRGLSVYTSYLIFNNSRNLLTSNWKNNLFSANSNTWFSFAVFMSLKSELQRVKQLISVLRWKTE